MTRMIPLIIAIIALSLEPPGALIQRAILGFRNAPTPNKMTTIPTIISMIFVISTVSL